MSTVTRDAEGTVTGNTYDKYGSSNPVVKKLMAGFERTLDELMQDYRPRLLDPVYAVSASKLLLETQVPPRLPTMLNNVCRGLARQVLERLELPEEE